jgi:hypothetical protein
MNEHHAPSLKAAARQHLPEHYATGGRALHAACPSVQPFDQRFVMTTSCTLARTIVKPGFDEKTSDNRNILAR